jgi:hypothetical protein
VTSTHPPTPDTEVDTPSGDHGRVLAVLPLGWAPGYRVPVRLTDDSVVTLVYAPWTEAPIELQHPVRWEDPERPAAPLACEIRPGDTLPPARGVPGRPGHLEDGGVTGVQAVTSVTHLTDPAEEVRFTTRDPQGRVRRYSYDPEEVVDLTRPRRKRPFKRRRAVQPERFDGPYVSPTGAQFIFQERPSTGGRPPAGSPRYDETWPLQLHPDTGDPMPYVVQAPTCGERLSAVRRSASILSPTARRTPEGQHCLRLEGLLPPVAEEAPDA